MEVPTAQQIFNKLLTEKLSYKRRLVIQAYRDFELGSIPPNELLRILSFYFNGDWTRDVTNEGFFLIKQDSIMLAEGKCTPNFRIQSHKKTILPGVVYFKSPEACKQAIRVFSKVHSIFKLY